MKKYVFEIYFGGDFCFESSHNVVLDYGKFFRLIDPNNVEHEAVAVL